MSSDTESTRSHDAPDPEDSRKPDSPTQLSGPARMFVVKKTIREFTKDECTDLAAALTYYAVLSLFPAILALVSLLGVVGQSQQTTDQLLAIVRDLGGASVVSTIEPTVQQLTQAPAAGVTLIVGLLVALWSASGYVGAFGRAMNRIYEQGEGRPFYKLRPIMLLITLVVLLLVALTGIGLVVSGPIAEAVGNAVGLGSLAVTVWSIAKWPVLLGIVVLIVALLYWATPNVRQPKFRWLSGGALVAILVWVVASVAFGFYVANFASYNATYGSLGGVIVFLLWLWITNLALLFGAELDAELERGRELQAGIAAEESIQLPPRDTKQLDKEAAKDAKEVDRARDIRRGSGQPPR